MAWKTVRRLQESDVVSPVSDGVLRKAESEIEGCERCDTASDVSFGAVLKCFLADRPGGHLSLERSPVCPKCQSKLTEDSLVSWD
jgi:hypothetical protein